MSCRHGKMDGCAACDEIASLRADAERYRWLTMMAWGKPVGDGYYELQFRTFLIRQRWTDTKAVADAAIDAAREAK
jgi:hypothetical protein